MTVITPAQILECWNESGNRRRLAPNEVLYQDGEEGESVFALLTSELELHYNNTVEVIHAGDVFGEESLILPEHKRFGTVVARTPSEIIILDRERFLFALQTAAPTLALAMLASLSERLRNHKSHNHSS